MEKNYLQSLIKAAKDKLSLYKLGKLKIGNDDYKRFLENIADKKCATCGCDLRVAKIDVKKEGNVESVLYEFECGHKHHAITISETIKAWAQIKGKFKGPDNSLRSTFLSRNEPGRNPKSTEGVEIIWEADKVNNVWSHIIKDIKTGKILHKELEPLDKHAKKPKEP